MNAKVTHEKQSFSVVLLYLCMIASLRDVIVQSPRARVSAEGH